MRKFLTLFSLTLFAFTASADVTYTNGFGDDGSYEPATLVNGYYEIDNGGKLFWFAQQVNAGTGKYYKAKLIANIDLEDRLWTPMGNSSKQFYGAFDGQGHIIKGLNIESSEQYTGFIGVHNHNSGENTDIVDFSLYGKIKYTGTGETSDWVAGVVAWDYGEHKMQDVWCYVNIETPNASGANYPKIGGVVGQVSKTYNTFDRCVYAGTITAGNAPYVGGIVAYPASSVGVVVSNCLYVGTIKSTRTNAYIGGIISYSNTTASSISNCLAAGSFELTGNTYAGTFCGYYAKQSFTNNYATTGGGLDKVVGTKGSNPCDPPATVTAAELTDGTLPTLLSPHNWIQGTNYPVPSLNHVYDSNGFCSYCDDGYQPATFDGTYYEIDNGGNLFWLAQQVNSGTGTAYNAKLTADIDLENRAWIPMGSAANTHGGEFDGRGYSITGLSVNTDAQYTAFIGYHNGTTSVHDFSLAGSVTYTGNTTDHCVAGVVAFNAGVNTVEDIICSVNIETPNATANVRIAGIVAREDNAGTINRCTYSGTNNGYGTAMQVAGIVGMAGDAGYNMKVTNCLFTGTLKATNTGAYVGGIAGYIGKSGTSFKNCLSAGSYDVPSGATRTGALIGAGNSQVTQTTFDNCYILDGQPEKGTSSGISATISYTAATNTTLTDGTVTTGLGDNWAQGTGNPVPKAFACTESNGGAAATVTGTVCAYNFDVFKNAVKDYATVDMSSANMTSNIADADVESMLTNNCLVYVPNTTDYCGKNIVNDGICDNFELTEGKPFAPTTGFEASAATYTRTISNAWGTICLPYAVESDDNVTYYTTGTISGDVLTLTSADKVPAGTPAICKFAATGENTIEAYPVPVNVCTDVAPDTQNDDINLIGSFTNQTIYATDVPNAYYISGGKFWHATGTLTVKPFRAYFTTSGSSSSNKFDIAIGDDDITAIEALTGEGDITVTAIYTADGKQISDLQQGLNIVKLSNGNTKKIILN